MGASKNQAFFVRCPIGKLEGDIVLVDVGAGTHFHPLDSILFANGHLTVTTPDPTSVLDLYRFITLAAIRRVLSAFGPVT